MLNTKGCCCYFYLLYTVTFGLQAAYSKKQVKAMLPLLGGGRSPGPCSSWLLPHSHFSPLVFLHGHFSPLVVSTRPLLSLGFSTLPLLSYGCFYMAMTTSLSCSFLHGHLSGFEPMDQQKTSSVPCYVVNIKDKPQNMLATSLYHIICRHQLILTKTADICKTHLCKITMPKDKIK